MTSNENITIFVMRKYISLTISVTSSNESNQTFLRLERLGNKQIETRFVIENVGSISQLHGIPIPL